MSELMTTQRNWQDFRRQLLITVSTLALLGSLCDSRGAKAEDTDSPTVWIELGGQLERMGAGQEAFVPPFAADLPGNFFSPSDVQKSLLYSYGGEGAVEFEPAGSDWVLSASLRFGRSNGVSRKHQQTPNAGVHVHLPILTQIGLQSNSTKYPSSHVKFEDASAQKNETHAILDFQAGKDVGLGMFGNGSSSVLSVGVRFAQFSSKMNASMHAEPDVQYPTQPISSIPALLAFNSAPIRFHDFAVAEIDRRSFHGVGPSVAWKATTPFAGSSNLGQMTFDWGANVAVLFGRQKADGHDQTTTRRYYKKKYGANGFATVSTTAHAHAASFGRARTIVVPNFGGFAALSFRYSNAKISLGYRGDFFFGAMDGGIDAAKKENVGFYGPFASVSVGLGG